MTAIECKEETSAQEPARLADIYRPEHNIAIWQRSVPLSIARGLAHLLGTGERLAVVQTVTPSTAAEHLLAELPDHYIVHALSQDIAMVVDMFCCLFDLKQAGLRLTSLDRAMCPRFHVDHLPCRLVTTYAGAATEWLANDDVDRTKLGAGSGGLPDDQSGIYSQAGAIRQMAAGDIALLKGSGWEGNEKQGLVHRSPQVSEGEQRLLLTLDFM